LPSRRITEVFHIEVSIIAPIGYTVALMNSGLAIDICAIYSLVVELNYYDSIWSSLLL